MGVPSKLADIIEEFAAAPRDLVLEMMLEFADAVRPLPASYAGHAGMEQVSECQTPFYLAAVVNADGRVELHFDCPPEAPTSRAFAGILSEGLSGATTAEVLAAPADLYERMGLAAVVSPLRVRGATAALHRLQRQVRAQTFSSEAR